MTASELDVVQPRVVAARRLLSHLVAADPVLAAGTVLGPRPHAKGAGAGWLHTGRLAGAEHPETVGGRVVAVSLNDQWRFEILGPS